MSTPSVLQRAQSQRHIELNDSMDEHSRECSTEDKQHDRAQMDAEVVDYLSDKFDHFVRIVYDCLARFTIAEDIIKKAAMAEEEPYNEYVNTTLVAMQFALVEIEKSKQALKQFDMPSLDDFLQTRKDSAHREAAQRSYEELHELPLEAFERLRLAWESARSSEMEQYTKHDIAY